MIHLPRLTAYRFVAAFVVLGYHLDVHSELPLGVFKHGGEAGVAFFFVLSGFILAWTYQGEARSFWLKRVARVYPAALGGVALSLLALALGVKGLFGSWAALLPSLTLTQAWFPQDEIRWGFNGLQWSLSCEIFFYACFPLIAAWLSRASTRGLLRLTIALSLVLPPVLIALVVVLPGSSLDVLWLWYTHPVARLPEFVVGVCAGLLVRSGWRLPVPLGAVLALYVLGALVGTVILPWGVWGSLTLPGTVLLIAAAATADLEGRRSVLLESPLAQYLGRISFCLYIVHAMVVLALVTWIDSQVVVGVLVLPLSLAFAVALHHAVEIPGHRWVMRAGRRRGVAAVPADR